jgi:hypothetical protein
MGSGPRRSRDTARKGAHTRTSLARLGSARLGFQWAQLVRVWCATSRARPSPAGFSWASGGARLAAGSLLARTCVGGGVPEPGSRIHKATRTDSVSFVTKRGAMSASMSKKFMSPDFFFDKVPWIAGSVAGSQRRLFEQGKAGRGLEFTRAVPFSILYLPNRPHSSSIITAAATCFDELILDAEMYEQISESAHACVVKYMRARLASQARRARRLRVWALYACARALPYQPRPFRYLPARCSLLFLTPVASLLPMQATSLSIHHRQRFLLPLLSCLVATVSRLCLPIFALFLSESHSSKFCGFQVPSQPIKSIVFLHVIFSVSCFILPEFLPGLLCDPEDGASMFLRKTGWFLQDFMALYPRRQNSS